MNPTPHPSLSELTRAAASIGCLSFGGPVGQIALMHTELVDRRRWISEEEFLHALNFCHLLPGPEAQQLATYIGWKLHGVRGGLIAGLLFIVPGALVVLALTLLYAQAAGLAWFAALFVGIKAAVLAIVVQALVRVGGRALPTRLARGIALAAFVALMSGLSFPLVILAAGLIGTIVAVRRPAAVAIGLPPRPRLTHTIRTIAIGVAVWAAPMILILATLGPGHVLFTIGMFFSKLAIVTFGGAYAVLAYMAQAAVDTHGWLRPGEMADGLGLAETTPGPLILVTQFVGFFAGLRAPAPFTPLASGILAAMLTTWVTFVPCFVWIFAFAPWIDRLRHAVRLKAALAAITAAVVGVIANLALWFALHVLFVGIGGNPVAGVRWPVLAIALVAAALLFRAKWPVWRLLVASGALGFATLL